MATSETASHSVQPSLDLDDGRTILGRKPSKDLEEGAASEMHPRDTSITKVNARYSPRGKRGQKYLAAGIKISLRLWEDEQPGKLKPSTQRDYETAGYVMSGRAELELEGQTVVLEPGDSWIIPKGAIHRYKVLEPFTAVEATCPPAEVHGRDEGA
jgi:mannose-6-phosphate isomerase-like protein (cupin superfamily)